LLPGGVTLGLFTTVRATKVLPKVATFHISTVKVTLLCGTLHFEKAFTFTARYPYLARAQLEMCGWPISILHGGFGRTFGSALFETDGDADAIIRIGISSNNVFINFFISEDDKIQNMNSKVIHSMKKKVN
jgi:hypothetical protein